MDQPVAAARLDCVSNHTGLSAQEQAAWDRGVYTRLPMFSRITADGVEWADGGQLHVDTILWATGFRAASRIPAAPSGALSTICINPSPRVLR